jgi:hypothetical protein
VSGQSSGIARDSTRACGNGASRCRARSTACGAKSLDNSRSQRAASCADSSPFAQPGSNAARYRSRGKAASNSARLRASYQLVR